MGRGWPGPVNLIYVSESREAVGGHIGVTPANFAAVAAEAAAAEVSRTGPAEGPGRCADVFGVARVIFSLSLSDVFIGTFPFLKTRVLHVGGGRLQGPSLCFAFGKWSSRAGSCRCSRTEGVRMRVSLFLWLFYHLSVSSHAPSSACCGFVAPFPQLWTLSLDS